MGKLKAHLGMTNDSISVCTTAGKSPRNRLCYASFMPLEMIFRDPKSSQIVLLNLV